MEHVVQFGINVDDDAIKKAIEKNVMMQVAGQIKGDVMKSITGKKERRKYGKENEMARGVRRLLYKIPKPTQGSCMVAPSRLHDNIDIFRGWSQGYL